MYHFTIRVSYQKKQTTKNPKKTKQLKNCFAMCLMKTDFHRSVYLWNMGPLWLSVGLPKLTVHGVDLRQWTAQAYGFKCTRTLAKRMSQTFHNIELLEHTHHVITDELSLLQRYYEWKRQNKPTHFPRPGRVKCRINKHTCDSCLWRASWERWSEEVVGALCGRRQRETAVKLRRNFQRRNREFQCQH